MKRKNRFETFKETSLRGSYDEFPMLELGLDPQVHLSRNTVAQPFFLICEQDTVLAQLAGESRIEFRNASVNYFNTTVGDYIYVPAGTPHRIVPKTESTHFRYKPEFPGLEAVAWYADGSNEEVARVTWDCATELSQDAYLRACSAFNGDAKMRTTVGGAVLPPIDLAPFRWAEVAAEIRQTEAGELARLQAKTNGKTVTATPRNTLSIPLPSEDSRVPLQRNVYQVVRDAPGNLTPMFPYTDPGSMVACVSMFDRAASGPIGYFIHTNTVMEVAVSFGTEYGFDVPGGVRVGQFRHGVGDKAGQDIVPNTLNIVCITQRQSLAAADQMEAVGFACEKCDHTIYEYRYNAHTFDGELSGEIDRLLVGLPFFSCMATARETFNADEKLRTCEKCGHVNPPTMPTDGWGWQMYKRRTQVAFRARTIMKEAAQPAMV